MSEVLALLIAVQSTQRQDLKSFKPCCKHQVHVHAMCKANGKKFGLSIFCILVAPINNALVSINLISKSVAEQDIIQKFKQLYHVLCF